MKLPILYALLVGTVVLGKRISDGNDKLVHLNIVYRHGDRAPVELYPNDPNNASFWTRGLGELTTKGCQMHYELGGYLRDHYDNFITGNNREILVKSSDANRCLESASCHLAAMYKPTSSQSFNADLPWQPLPIHTRPVTEDGLLAPGNNNCPFADRAFDEQKKTPEAQKILNKYADFYKNLTTLTGTNITDWVTASYIYECVMIENLYKLPIPEWATAAFNELSYQSDLLFIWFAKSPLLQRFRAGPLAKEILDNLKKASTKPDEVKINMYSTHDTEVSSLLQLYDLFDNKCPMYCATVIVELWQDTSSGSFTVKINYLNYYNREFKVLLEIPLTSFEARITPKLPVNWSSECGRQMNYL